MRHTTALLAVGLLACLTACGSSGDDKPAAAKPKAKPTVSKDDQFLNVALDLEYTDGRPTNAELLEFPPKWCKELEAGHSVKYMFDMSGPDLYPYGLTWGLKDEAAYELLVAGVRVYCPTYRDQVVEELQASGKY